MCCLFVFNSILFLILCSIFSYTFPQIYLLKGELVRELPSPELRSTRFLSSCLALIQFLWTLRLIWQIVYNVEVVPHIV